MRRFTGIALAALLLVLLSALSLFGLDPEASRYDRALATLTAFEVAESALRQDTLNARAGLLLNYDPLDRELAVLRDSVGQLHKEHVDEDVLGPLQKLTGQQDTLVEEFKSNNALLRNSLAYFGLLNGRFGVDASNGPLASAVTSLATAMLHLTLDTSGEAADEVQEGLNRLAAEGRSEKDAGLVAGLLRHGHLLHDLLPATDSVIRLLYNLPYSQRLDNARTNILAHQRDSRAAARHYSILLYATSLILLILLGHLGSQLRRHVQALRRRAAFEHAVAAISMSFICAETNQLSDRVEQALGELAEWIGADRAYFVVSAVPLQCSIRSRHDIDWPPGWPMQAPTLAARIHANTTKADAEEIIHIPSVDALSAGPVKDALRTAGLHGWLAILASSHDGTCGVLGFDALHRPLDWPSGELGLLRMAVETVVNAVGRAQLEREQVRLEASLQQARRMETIGALASGVAHNFNNIIGAILGYTEMEEAHAAPQSRLARNLAGIRHTSERARDLVDQILSYGRQREPSRRPVNLPVLMEETRSLLSASLPPAAQIAVGAIPGEAVVTGEAVQLQQVIINLCNNAVQAMRQPCIVEVTADLHILSQPRPLSHGTLKPGRYVSISVHDNGRGMDAATLERLFEPFFTTRMGGNGLGLATVREIVRTHNGALNVMSDPNDGSVFEVWLPLATTVPTAADPPAAVCGAGEIILLINQDRTRLLHDEEIVAALGYEPVGFAEPEQAVAACREAPKRFDAVLVTHLMPTTRALLATAALRATVPDLPILLATATDELNADALAGAGISDIVAKPLISAELASALSRSLTSLGRPAHLDSDRPVSDA